MSDAKLVKMYRVVTDAWALYKKYFGTRRHEQDKWDALVADAVEYQNKHDCLLARTFAMGVMEQLEEEDMDTRLESLEFYMRQLRC